MESPQKVSIGRTVLYNHPGSLDGKYPPVQSPAVVQKVYIEQSVKDGAQCEHVDLFVMSVTGGIFFAKAVEEGELGKGSSWMWPPRV